MDPALFTSLIVTITAFIGIWLIHVLKEDAGVIDFYWGPGFVVIGAVTWAFHGFQTSWHLAFMGAITLWATRLTWHLGRRHMSAETEDARYLKMRENGGPNYWWISLFKVFILQAFILWAVAAPVHVAMHEPVSENFNVALFALGMTLFVIGFVVETIADYQIEAEKMARQHTTSTPKLVGSGLWSRSRHPNYFGELVLWWGLGLSSFAMSASWVAFAGPGLLTLVMIGISIPLTEQWMERSRPGYKQYKAVTPMLIPAFVKPRGPAKQPVT
ncbi:MAG: DUF1295 domain-containing protein [Pseudomonadota bacterium]